MPCERNTVCACVSRSRVCKRSNIKKQKGSSSKVRRAQVLLKANAAGPCWTDAKIADAYDFPTKTMENILERFLTEEFKMTLIGQKHKNPPRPKLLHDNQQAKVIALRL